MSMRIFMVNCCFIHSSFANNFLLFCFSQLPISTTGLHRLTASFDKIFLTLSRDVIEFFLQQCSTNYSIFRNECNVIKINLAKLCHGCIALFIYSSRFAKFLTFTDFSEEKRRKKYESLYCVKWNAHLQVCCCYYDLRVVRHRKLSCWWYH